MGMVIDYALVSGNGRARFGTIRAIFNSSTIIIDETSTTDLGGTTAAITFSGGTGANASIRVDNATGGADDTDVRATVRLIARP